MGEKTERKVGPFLALSRGISSAELRREKKRRKEGAQGYRWLWLVTLEKLVRNSAFLSFEIDFNPKKDWI